MYDTIADGIINGFEDGFKSVFNSFKALLLVDGRRGSEDQDHDVHGLRSGRDGRGQRHHGDDRQRHHGRGDLVHGRHVQRRHGLFWAAERAAGWQLITSAVTGIGSATTALRSCGGRWCHRPAAWRAVFFAFKAFQTSTKELDAGLKLVVSDQETIVEGYKKIQSSRFFGLSNLLTPKTSGRAARSPTRSRRPSLRHAGRHPCHGQVARHRVEGVRRLPR